MKKIRKDIFVFLFGHNRGGTSATMGFLNLSPNLNIAFEANQKFLRVGEENNSKFLDRFRQKKFVLDCCFNGNKAVYSEIPAWQWIKCIEKKTFITHSQFLEAKFIFVERNPVDTICSRYLRNKLTGKSKFKNLTAKIVVDRWIASLKVSIDLKKYVLENHGGYFEFDFYSFLKEDSIKKELYFFLGEEWKDEYLSTNPSTIIYGREKKLDMKYVIFAANKHQDVKDEIRFELEKLGIKC